MQATQPTPRPTDPRHAGDEHAMRTNEFRPRRVRWPGLLGVGAIAAAVIFGVVYHYTAAPEMSSPAATAPAATTAPTPPTSQ